MQMVLFYSLLFITSVWDVRKKEIPDYLNVALAVTALFQFQWSALFGILSAVLLLARALNGGIGGGDVKMAAACGLVLGLPSAMAGAVLRLTLLLLFHGGTKFVMAVLGKKAAASYPLAPFLALGYAAAYYLRADWMKKWIVRAGSLAGIMLLVHFMRKGKRRKFAAMH